MTNTTNGNGNVPVQRRFDIGGVGPSFQRFAVGDHVTAKHGWFPESIGVVEAILSISRGEYAVTFRNRRHVMWSEDLRPAAANYDGATA